MVDSEIRQKNGELVAVKPSEAAGKFSNTTVQWSDMAEEVGKSQMTLLKTIAGLSFEEC